jgi:CHAT domain-containing protein
MATGRHTRSISIGIIWLLTSTFFFSATTAAEAQMPRAAFDRGLGAFERGAFDEAVVSWRRAVASYEKSGDRGMQLVTLLHLSQAQSMLGQYSDAARSLQTALSLAEVSNDGRKIAAVLAALGNVHVVLGPHELASTYLERAVRLAREAAAPAVAAAALNDLGNVRATEGKHADAFAAYRESIGLAKAGGQQILMARASTNASGVLRQLGRAQEVPALLDAAFAELRPTKPSHEMAFALVGIGLAYRDMRNALPAVSDSLLLRAAEALRAAARAADTIGDKRTASYAWGYLGTSYEDERRYSEALQLTRHAIFAAQQTNAPESLYRWQWQAGRLLKQLGSIDDAIASYQRAVATLQAVRPELTVTYGGRATAFREGIGPVYFQLVDLLLQRASSGQAVDKTAATLVEARNTIELFKAAELRDYFRDDCVDTALSKVTSLDVLSRTATVVYPVILENRLVLVVSLPQGLKSIVVPVTGETLTQEVRQFRLKLEKRTTREYLPHAQKLYDWLIRPLEPDLAAARTETLVFVPDGALRTIPMAALHDGKQFLVAKYALAITPGLSLTDPRPIQREHARVLAVGVTESVQGFPALPSVAPEIDMLRATFKTTALVDRDFSASKFEAALKAEPYTIVHVASHGQFDADVTKAFLLTFDDKVSMERLDKFIGVLKFRDDPLELLTLSACDTAAGDDKAALGLAGIAIKAGARSAMATLWQVHDEVAADLVAAFYKELQNPSVSRAVALRRAQLRILSNPRYEHPGFWAPFLMINNWL